MMPLPPGNTTRTLTVDGRERSYVLHVPPGHDISVSQPVVLAIHGALSNPKLMEKFSGLSEFADAKGFLVVYPAGTGNTASTLTWNGGSCCGYAQKHQVDDFAYFRALLADLATIVNLDPQRVYLTGMSNGAHMAYRLASEMAERIAAIACVAGPMAIDECRPSRPVPVLHIHGTDDEFAPFAGGEGPKSIFGISFPSIAETIRRWVDANGCAPEPIVETLPDRAHDGTTVVRHRYVACKEGAEVILYVVENGGHTWPGRPPLPLSLGKSTNNLDANETIWEFFQRHRR